MSQQTNIRSLVAHMYNRAIMTGIVMTVAMSKLLSIELKWDDAGVGNPQCPV